MTIVRVRPSKWHRRRRDTNLMYLRTLSMAFGNPRAMSILRNGVRSLMYKVASEVGEEKYYNGMSEKHRARVTEALLSEELSLEIDSEV